MNFQGYLENTYRIIKAEPVILLLGGLLIQLLNSVTLSILYGPLFGGYMLMAILLLRDEKKPAFNDLFNGFQFFRLLFPYFFVLLAKLIGFMLFVLPGILFATWWIYVLPLMVDRKIGFGEAMRISSDKVSETGFFMHMVFLLLVYVIPVIILQILVSFLPFLMVLTLLLMPFQVGCMASLYIDQFRESATESDSEHKEKTDEAAPVTLPLAKKTGDQVEQESSQSEQPVSEKQAASELPADVSLPEKGVPGEKHVQGADTDQHQVEEESDQDAEEDNKDTI